MKIPQSPVNASELNSPNFSFLSASQPFLVHLAIGAERYLFDDPSTALFKLRQFAELLGRQVLVQIGIESTPADTFETVLFRIRDERAASAEVLDLFHGIRKAGNAAVHDATGDRTTALHQL